MTTDDKTLVQFKNSNGVTQTSKPIAGGFARPNPGGRSAVPPPRQVPIAPISDPAFQAAPIYPMHQQWAAHSSAGDNPLLSAGDVLIQKMAELTTSKEAQDIVPFRDWCVGQIQRFEQQCLQCNVGEETRHYARYILCTSIDELVNKTHWGAGVWSSQSLLSQFHSETDGGERFFQLLEYLQQTPAKNIALLELMYVCLSLGFEGKYRLDKNGYAQLESLRDNLFHLIRLQRGEPEHDLSPHWQRVTARRNPLARYLPLWVVVAVVGVMLLATFSGFSYLLNGRSTAFVSELQRSVDQ